ncbi:hypothetical protein BDK51DRAFT_44875 [Blyttiomyces helicus]|uniref:Uncharacterized protein n=1 Tax=Blyttiomyces helicus TaxID=388810 RepID=A0A4P9W7W9_9FUNG|nr:hypothetical protein BDK51DRAFT_44875 [Blyttiomyces helicus]|eukprot:RKO88484.1 hypothetical protein BDK51DRAFT_44875 [Blyttiomyces helicus]
MKEDGSQKDREEEWTKSQAKKHTNIVIATYSATTGRIPCRFTSFHRPDRLAWPVSGQKTLRRPKSLSPSQTHPPSDLLPLEANLISWVRELGCQPSAPLDKATAPCSPPAASCSAFFSRSFPAFDLDRGPQLFRIIQVLLSGENGTTVAASMQFAREMVIGDSDGEGNSKPKVIGRERGTSLNADLIASSLIARLGPLLLPRLTDAFLEAVWSLSVLLSLPGQAEKAEDPDSEGLICSEYERGERNGKPIRVVFDRRSLVGTGYSLPGFWTAGLSPPLPDSKILADLKQFPAVLHLISEVSDSAVTVSLGLSNLSVCEVPLLRRKLAVSLGLPNLPHPLLRDRVRILRFLQPLDGKKRPAALQALWENPVLLTYDALVKFERAAAIRVGGDATRADQVRMLTIDIKLRDGWSLPFLPRLVRRLMLQEPLRFHRRRVHWRGRAPQSLCIRPLRGTSKWPSLNDGSLAAYSANCLQLVRVDLSDSIVTDTVVMDLLALCLTIQELDLTRTDITAITILALKDYWPLTFLRVGFNGRLFKDQSDAEMATLIRLRGSHLERLALGSDTYVMSAALALVLLDTCPRLAALMIYGATPEDVLVRLASRLPNLRSLAVAETDVECRLVIKRLAVPRSIEAWRFNTWGKKEEERKYFEREAPGPVLAPEKAATAVHMHHLRVLEVIGLKQHVSRHRGKLDKNGSDLFVGQCQLLCLGRDFIFNFSALVSSSWTKPPVP